MSQENVDLHRRAVEAFNTHDVEAFIALMDPSIEAHSVFAAVGAVYHGHDGLRRFFRDARDSWGDEIRIEPEAYFELGEHTVAFQVLHGSGRHSMAEVTMPVAAVVGWRDGLNDPLQGVPRQGGGVRDLGLSRDELEPITP